MKLAQLRARLHTLLTGSLRSQLILGVALVHAVLMAGFVWDLTLRQRDMLTNQQAESAEALAQSLATTSAGWVAARDLAGLREIVLAQSRYPELVYAMILDRQGMVLAHGDPTRHGQFVRDLPTTAQAVLLARSQALIDVAVPVRLAGQHIGWVRVGLTQKVSQARLAEITRDGVLYALAAILLGAVMAGFMARLLTRRLAVIENVADAVEHGDFAQRVKLKGTDEAARLAGAFDRMLDGLSSSRDALVNSEQNLRFALGAASMRAWRWDIDTGRTSWGEDPQALLGPRPARGYPDFSDLVLAEDREAFLAAGRKALAGQGDYHSEFRIRRTDGRMIWLLATGRVMRDANGSALAVLGVSWDISVRKYTEAQLSKLSLAVEQSPESIVITDLGARIEYVNEAFVRTAGYSRESLVGENPRILQSGKTPRETYIVMWQALRAGQSWSGELFNRREDGSEYTERAIITPIRQSDGRVTHYVAIKQDITEQKRLSEEINRHREHLEDMVLERTVELTAARAAAERLTQAKSEFLANMSHELRTPLNGVLGLARIGMRDNVGRSSHETFVRIMNSGDHLLHVINNILDFSKLDAGKLLVESRTFALAAAIDNAVSFVSGEAKEKGLDVEISTAADLPHWVSGDVHRLQQILINLLSNAVKFTERGEVRLRVARQDETIYFKVIDSGIGMSEEQAARLFLPFEQADSSTTRRYGGTGLGLAISRNLARFMGGEITVDCAPGAGCSFTLSLPLPVSEPHLPAPIVDPDDDPAAPAQPRLTGLRLLAAEDVEINRLILEDLLSHEGAHVVFAENGQEALDKLEESGVIAFDAVLMDVQMPVMNGLEATRRLRQIAPALPVIGLTAHAFAEEREKCLAAGMAEHVAKPINPEMLVAAIQRQTGHVARGAGATSPEISESVETLSSVTRAPTFREHPSPSPINASLVDWPGLQARYPGREAFVNRLATIALDSQREIATKLRAAVRQRDLEALSFLAHTLKGVGGNLMAQGVQDLAARAEIEARKNNPQATALATELATELADQADALLIELATRIREEEGP